MRRWRHFNKGQHWKFWRMHNSTSQVLPPPLSSQSGWPGMTTKGYPKMWLRSAIWFLDKETKHVLFITSSPGFSLFRSVLVGVHAGVCLGQRTYTFHKLCVFHYFPIVVFLLFEIQSAGLYPGLPNLTWFSLPADNNILLPGENFRLNRRQIFWGKRKYSSLERKVHPFHILSSPVIYFCNNWSCAILLALHPNNPFKIVLAASFDLVEFQFHF